jgi:phage major head subunit gpT-like protein
MPAVKNMRQPKGQPMSNKIQTPKLNIRAMIEPETFDREKRTVEVTWSTGAKGKRYTWTGSYYEELSMKKEHIRLERMNQGAPVLNSHNSWDLKSNMGVVEKAWIKDKQGRAVIRFSSREEIQGIIKDIEDGIIRNISVGYIVHKFEDVSKKGDTVPTYRAVDWEPMEISFVNIPFDKDSQVRSLETNKDKFETEIIPREIEMEGETTETTETVATETKETVENKSVEENSVTTENKEERSENLETKTAPVAETKEVSVDKIEQEKQRGIEIRKASEAAGLDSAFSDKLIAENVEVDQARKLIIDEMATRNKTTKTNNHSVEVKDVDQRKMRIEMASNALMHRAQGDKIKLHDDARQFRGMSLLRLAEECLTAQGIANVRLLSPNEIADRALHSSSDFVEILANVANKTLRQGYEEAPQTFASFVRRVQVADFKQISRTQLGDAPKLEKVGENGEYKSGKVSEAAEKYSVETFGKIIGVTRKTLVNDDMDAFSRLPEMFGRSARDLESELIYGIIAANPLMADGNALFSSAHGNLGTAAVIGVPSISEARSKMRLQKGLDNKFLNLMPKTLLVPTVLETAAEQFVGPIMPNQVGQANPFTGKFGIIAEPRLDGISATAWYLLAAITQCDIFELATLIGQDGPTLSTKDGFNVDGVQFKVSYDVGVKAIDWRGIFKNAGA